MRTAAQLAGLIKQFCKMDIAEIGDTDQQQNTFIFDFMSRALNELADYAGVVEVSDPLVVSTDGYQTFKLSGVDVSDMYAPIRILDTNGCPIERRSDFPDQCGWFRESFSTQIHFKGVTGTFTLYYKAYPDEITDGGQTPQFPAAGYMVLVYWACAMIKESKGFFDEANHFYQLANSKMPILHKANADGKGRRKTANIVNHWG